MSAPLSRDEARARGLPGWNIRCNPCGSYGAEWVSRIDGAAARPGWGCLALCPPCAEALRVGTARHEAAVREMRTVRFEQERHR